VHKGQGVVRPDGRRVFGTARTAAKALANRAWKGKPELKAELRPRLVAA
jgi:hypothetical protein